MQKETNSTLQELQGNGSYELLSTKLAIPHLRSPIVPRQHLLAQLDDGLEHKLTLISAPAGFGKTTLVAEWVAGMGESLSNLRPSPMVAWVSLDAGDNDPVRFWRYVLTACQAFEAGVGAPALALLNASQQPHFETVLTVLINDLTRLSNQGILVLEDYHAITSRQIHDTVTFFLEHLPATVHLVLVTRSDPPLPLARIRAHNELNELRAADLRFSPQEIQAFLKQITPLEFSSEAVARITERTEGWAAGLRLMALALQGRKEQPEALYFLATFTGSHRPILEYLVADVFSAQPEPLQEFLLETSILRRLAGPLCDAVTGRSDSARILEQLESANLFLSPLEGPGEWYRYHDLFAEAMQHYARIRLGEARLCELSQRASLWYEKHGMLAEAVEAALSAQDFPRAAHLIARIIAPRLVQNEFHTLRRWMEQLPEPVLREHPEICMTYAVSILFTSDRHAPETKALLQTPLQIAEQHWQRQENDARLGEVLAFHSLVDWLQGDVDQSFMLARQALELLPEGERQWRGISLIFVAVEEMMAGRLDAARQTLSEARSLCELSENIYGTLDSMLLLAEVVAGQAELHQAAQIYQQVLKRVEDAPMNQDQTLIRRGRAQLGLGTLALEWNDLEQAEQDVSEGVAVTQQFPEEDLLEHSPLVLARVKHARLETAQAQQVLLSLVAQTKRPLLARQARALLARHALAAGDLPFVQRWAAAGQPQEAIPVLQQEQEALIRARMLVALGEAAQALRMLEGWQAEAHAQGRARSEMEIKLVAGLAHAARGEVTQARQILIEILALAQPEGFRRLFLDEGQPLAALLQAALPEIQDDSLAAYARALLYNLAQERTAQENAALGDTGLSSAQLAEPLSAQEARILRLLAAGLSNPEIARELIISTNTVKTHIKSIYRKLNVNNRREAREAAQQLNLL